MRKKLQYCSIEIVFRLQRFSFPYGFVVTLSYITDFLCLGCNWKRKTCFELPSSMTRVLTLAKFLFIILNHQSKAILKKIRENKKKLNRTAISRFNLNGHIEKILPQNRTSLHNIIRSIRQKWTYVEVLHTSLIYRSIQPKS